MVVESDPDLPFHESMKQLFGSDEVLSIAIKMNDPFAPESLALQQQLAEDIAALSFVVDVDSLATSHDVLPRNGILQIVPLIRSESAHADATYIRQRVERNPLWHGLLVAKSHDAIALQITLDDAHEAELKRADTINAIEQILDSTVGKGTYFLAGHPYMKHEISRSIERDLSRFVPPAILVMVAVLWLVFRNVLLSAVVIAWILLSIASTLGLMGWIGLPITAVSNTAPPVLLALGVAASLHLPAAWARVAGNWHQSLIKALSLTRRPVAIATVTTAAGYLSLSLSSVPIIRQFGMALALGVVVTGFMILTALPASLQLLGAHARPSNAPLTSPLHAFLLRANYLTASHAALLFISALLLAIIFAGSALQLRIDSSGPNKFSPNSRFHQSSEFYRAHMSGDVVGTLFLGGPEDQFLQPDTLRSVKEFERAALALPAIDKTLSLATLVEVLNREFHGGYDSDLQIPDSAEAVAQLLLLYETESESLRSFVDGQFATARVVLRATVPSSAASSSLRRRLEQLAEIHLGHIPERTVISTEILLSQAADTIAIQQVRSAGLALLIVVTLVSALFRSVKAGVLIVLPNLLPILANLGLMGALGIPLGDATSIIPATALGIAVDGTVHLLAAARDRSDVTGHEAPATLALLHAGPPVIASTCVVVLGFSVLCLSEFRAVAQLGGLTALTMVYCLIADLFVLPAQLRLFGK
jgi:uncharacterized protein